MKASERVGLTSMLACTALLAAACTGGHATPDPLKGPYVALGDSYTSGPGIPNQTGKPAGCARSDHNYPSLVAERLELKAAGFRDMSCSGAAVTDLSTAQSTKDGTNPAQFTALSKSTRLITLGIGGNDIGFTSLITQCVKQGVIYRLTKGLSAADGAPCRAHYVSAGTDEVKQRVDEAGVQLAKALTQIKHRAPNARVYVVGYPAIVPPQDTNCGRELVLAAKDVTYLHAKEQQLNAMLRERAEAAGAEYVDTYTPSIGHDACSAEKTRWVEPLIPGSRAVSAHPNQRGEQGMANAVLHTMHVPDAKQLISAE